MFCYGWFTDILQEELESKHLLEMEEAGRMHSQQMMVARMELDRALELTKQKVGEIIHLIKSLRSNRWIIK